MLMEPTELANTDQLGLGRGSEVAPALSMLRAGPDPVWALMCARTRLAIVRSRLNQEPRTLRKSLIPTRFATQSVSPDLQHQCHLGG